MVRAALLTILGEAVLPRGGKVWQEALVRGLQALGTSPTAARQAISRASREGWMISERIGRRSLLTISEETTRRLVEGRDLTFSFGATVDWDGRWLLVTFTVPEDQRSVRYQARTQLAWLGFGSLGNGIWISPHTRHEQAAREALKLGTGAIEAMVFVADARSHDPREIARTVWDLDYVHGRYTDFLATFDRPTPDSDEAAFAEWIQLIGAWRQFPGFDPQLPDSLLPAMWPRQVARDLFRRRQAELVDRGSDYFARLGQA
jgi:phenylacetic acid degradation operon negative regulatory protein